MSRYRVVPRISTEQLDVGGTERAALAGATHDELVELVQESRLFATQMENSRTSHRRIGIATGVLMGLQRLPEAEAFEIMRRASMNLNLKLVEVAEHVIETGVVPTSTAAAHSWAKAKGEMTDEPDRSTAG